MKNWAEILESDVPGAVIDLVEDVVDLHLGGVGPGPPHGREERALRNLPIASPVETIKGGPERKVAALNIFDKIWR